LPSRNIPPPATSDEIAQLREELTDLKNQVRVLSDILDEIRVDLQWVTQNGLPIRESLPACPTLKRMALDPCADDWGERLVIEFGEPRRTAETVSHAGDGAKPLPSQSPAVAKPPPGKLFSEVGDQRRLF
jgi:hypothetical protein